MLFLFSRNYIMLLTEAQAVLLHFQEAQAVLLVEAHIVLFPFSGKYNCVFLLSESTVVLPSRRSTCCASSRKFVLPKEKFK